MTSEPAPKLELFGTRLFIHWLADQRVSLAFSTYQAGKVFLIGLQPDGGMSVVERTFGRAMGLWASPKTLYLATHYQLWRFDNALDPGQVYEGYDRLYVPQLAWTTGNLDIHDVAVDGQGRVVFVNTLFGCVSTVSDSHNFSPLWQPPFISRLAAEDRCHLNGIAIRDGRPRYATAVSRSDVADGWRDRRVDGGVVIDMESNEIVLEGLSMPHSPRWYRDRLWLLDSGNGYLGWADLERGRFERVAFCPGYARGLTMIGPYAVVGLSKPRENKTFSGLPLDDELRSRDGEPRCGLMIIDLESGDSPCALRIEGIIEELYDVSVIPGVVRPLALGLRDDQIRRLIRMGPKGAL